jgi:hypothetical protein
MHSFFSSKATTCFLIKKGLVTLSVVIGFTYALPSLQKFDFQPKKKPKYPLGFELPFLFNCFSIFTARCVISLILI